MEDFKTYNAHYNSFFKSSACRFTEIEPETVPPKIIELFNISQNLGLLFQQQTAALILLFLLTSRNSLTTNIFQFSVQVGEIYNLTSELREFTYLPNEHNYIFIYQFRIKALVAFKPALIPSAKTKTVNYSAFYMHVIFVGKINFTYSFQTFIFHTNYIEQTSSLGTGCFI